MAFIFRSLDVDDRVRRGKEVNPFADTNGTRNIAHVTLLSRQYHYVLPFTISMYASLQYLIGTKSNICSTNRQPTSDATTTVFYCACACFFISGLQQAIKIHSYRNHSMGCMSRSIFFAGLTISCIAGSSSFLTGNEQKRLLLTI